jgi:acyl-CoA reductase-like NAD-dependent aldehyde dehydrogenase
VLVGHADELAELLSRENGKPVADARLHDVGFLAGIFRFFGSLADKLPSEFYDKGSIYTSTVIEPLGVWGSGNQPPVLTWASMRPARAR